MEGGKGFNRADIPEAILKMKKFLQFISVTKICCGSVLVIIGIIALATMKSNPEFPFTSGSQLWSGAIVLGAGISGYLMTVNIDLNQDSFKRLRCFMGLHYGLCIAVMGTSGVNLGYSISAILKCKKDTCADDDTFMIVIMAISVALSAISLQFGICGLQIYCRNRSLLRGNCTPSKCEVKEKNQKVFET